MGINPSNQFIQGSLRKYVTRVNSANVLWIDFSKVRGLFWKIAATTAAPSWVGMFPRVGWLLTRA